MGMDISSDGIDVVVVGEPQDEENDETTSHGVPTKQNVQKDEIVAHISDHVEDGDNILKHEGTIMTSGDKRPLQKITNQSESGNINSELNSSLKIESDKNKVKTFKKENEESNENLRSAANADIETKDSKDYL